MWSRVALKVSMVLKKAVENCGGSVLEMRECNSYGVSKLLLISTFKLLRTRIQQAIETSLFHIRYDIPYNVTVLGTVSILQATPRRYPADDGGLS
jgi:hypothetical protein